jgi:hypothetical protein
VDKFRDQIFFSKTVLSQSLSRISTCRYVGLNPLRLGHVHKRQYTQIIASMLFRVQKFIWYMTSLGHVHLLVMRASLHTNDSVGIFIFGSDDPIDHLEM